jgi:hypothetical protein
MKQLPIMSATHLCVNVVMVLSWQTLLPGWITHCFGVVCKRGYGFELASPPAGLDYTLFWRCHIPLSVILQKRLYISLLSKY